VIEKALLNEKALEGLRHNQSVYVHLHEYSDCSFRLGWADGMTWMTMLCEHGQAFFKPRLPQMRNLLPRDYVLLCGGKFTMSGEDVAQVP
jgi:hypothetical protein